MLFRSIMNELGSSSKERVELTNSFHVATLDFDDQIIFERSLKFVLDHRAFS